jgi:bifunctional DNA-binding transcriptional regulator/antitoxin component of YhaV-PrlF toxin-antitoxin module
LIYIEVDSCLQGKLVGNSKFRIITREEIEGVVKGIQPDDLYISVCDIRDSLDDTQMVEVRRVDRLLGLGVRPLLVVIYEGQINKLDIFMCWLNQKSMYLVFHLLHSDFLDMEYVMKVLKQRYTSVDFGNYILADSGVRDGHLVDDLYDLMDSVSGEVLDVSDIGRVVLPMELLDFNGLMERTVNLITAQEVVVSRIHKIEDKSGVLEKTQEELRKAEGALYGIEKEYETRLIDAAASQLGVGNEESSVGTYVRFNINTLKFKGKIVYFKCLDNLIYFKTMITAFNDFLGTPMSKGRAVNAPNSRIIVLDYWRPSLGLEYGDCEIVTAKNYRVEKDRIQRSKKPIILTSVNHVIIKSILEEHYSMTGGILIVVDYLGYYETLFMYNVNEFYVASSIGLVRRYEEEVGIKVPQGRIITRGYPSDARYTETLGLPQIQGVAGMRLRDRVAKVKNTPNVNSSMKGNKILEVLADSII